MPSIPHTRETRRAKEATEKLYECGFCVTVRVCVYVWMNAHAYVNVNVAVGRYAMMRYSVQRRPRCVWHLGESNLARGFVRLLCVKRSVELYFFHACDFVESR